MNLKRCALNLGESMCARRHTHSTQPCCFSLFCPCANFPKTKPWLRWIHCPTIIQDFKENPTRFHRAIHYTVKDGPTPSNTSPERLFAMVPGPIPEHNSTNPILWNGVYRQCWRTSLQAGNPVLMGNVSSLPVPEQITHTLPPLCTAWESLAG